MKLGILKEFNNKHEGYIKACEDLNVEYEVIDFISNDWIDNINKSNCDGFLVRPSFYKQVWKTMFDERLYFLNKVMKKPIFPSYDECLIYENKKNMEYYMTINNIPHAKTYIFYDKKEALKLLSNEKIYPLVFKPNIASAGVGIEVVNNKGQAMKLINRIFTKKGVFGRGFIKWHKTGKLKFIKKPSLDDRQYNFAIFQEKLNIKTEWRIINIGGSFFGHQKLEGDNHLHSGSGKVGWIKPPLKLLDMVEKICKEGNFESMDCDIFETNDGEYYVNELQTIFGSYDNSQMYIDGVPGRYIKVNNKWKFEEGYFNQNGSQNLRVETFIRQLKNTKR